MWKSIFNWCKAWISKKENQQAVIDAAKQAADALKKKDEGK